MMTAAPSVQARWRKGATRLGISLDEYARRVLAGLRWCSNQGHGWRPVAEFGIARGKRSGLTTYCRPCDRSTALARIQRKRAAAS